MNTVYCNSCSAQLSYPVGSPYIQCPKCKQVMNPQAPHQTTCISCRAQLAHPATSLYIQCPKCLQVMNARENVQRQAQTMPMAGHTNPLATMEMQHQKYYGFPNQDSPLQNKVKPKKKRDPKAPKAASNAYMIFCKQMRPKIKQDGSELTFGKLGAKLGEIWRNLSVEEKKPYEDEAAEDRERYRKEMEEYQALGVIEEVNLLEAVKNQQQHRNAPLPNLGSNVGFSHCPKLENSNQDFMDNSTAEKSEITDSLKQNDIMHDPIHPEELSLPELAQSDLTHPESLAQ